jgi:hypothetical protein
MCITMMPTRRRRLGTTGVVCHHHHHHHHRRLVPPDNGGDIVSRQHNGSLDAGYVIQQNDQPSVLSTFNNIDKKFSNGRSQFDSF